MKIKKEIVLQSFEHLTQTTTNKFWGLLCVFYAIETKQIKSGYTYRINTKKLSEKLQNFFYYGTFKTFNPNYYFVRFSNYWLEAFEGLRLVKGKPKLENIAIFYFKDEIFENAISNLELVQKLLNELKLTQKDVNYLFELPRNMIKIELENDYKKEKIFDLIKTTYKINSSHNTLTVEKPFSIISHPAELQRAPFFQTLYSGTQIQKLLILTKFDFDDYYVQQKIKTKISPPKNLIYYGAPGTGKSYKIETEVLNGVPQAQQERVTFHPDYDHAAFIGSYMPKSDTAGNITYQFVPQVFTNIYVKAWQNLGKAYFLVIEEINRGNCAEIFGDIFQLLDRRANYPITPKYALKEYLIENLERKGYGGIKDGKIVLPPNLQLLATMNTSDQSLFPMDSAFKRRWTWKYVPINYNKNEAENTSAGFYVDFGDGRIFSWLEFIEKMNKNFIKVNEYLGEDKCIGNYFIKPDDKAISLETFINKAIFYLWIDVFREEDETPFENGTTYSDFFPEESAGKSLVEKMVNKLGVKIENLSEISNT